MSGVGYHPPGEMATVETETMPVSRSSYSYRYLVYTLLIILLLVFLVWLTYAVVTRPDDQFIVGQFLLAVPPYAWAQLGLASAVILPIIGGGWYVLLCAWPLTHRVGECSSSERASWAQP